MNELIRHCKSIAEFGGPSPLFEDIYKLFPDIDGFNLFKDNYWQKDFKPNYKGQGKQYNQDVVVLEPEKMYDLMICSHVIEHIANPLFAIETWEAYLNEGGFILSIIPDKSQMFDCKRPLTTIEHLVKDYFEDTSEADETHIFEAINLFVNNGGYDYNNYVKSSKDNFKYRAIHHHCFDAYLVRKMFEYLHLKVIKQEQSRMHIKTLVQL